jgi:hypothetical protein
MLCLYFVRQIHDTYFLVAIIDNDYVEGTLLFDVFDEIIAVDKELRQSAADGESEADSALTKSNPTAGSEPSEEWF